MMEEIQCEVSILRGLHHSSTASVIASQPPLVDPSAAQEAKFANVPEEEVVAQLNEITTEATQEDEANPHPHPNPNGPAPSPPAELPATAAPAAKPAPKKGLVVVKKVRGIFSFPPRLPCPT